MRGLTLSVALTCLCLIPVPLSAQEDDAKTSAKSAAEQEMAKLAALGPGVRAIQKDKKGRITSCIVVGQSRISTALGESKGLEVARKRADLSASAEFVKWLKQDVTVVENTDDETVTLLEGTEKESGKAVEKTGSKMTSISQGLVRGLQVLHVKTDGENKTITVLKGWKAATAEGVKKVASDSKKDDPDSAEAGTSKSDSKEVKPKNGDKEIQDSESTSSDASDYLPKKKSE
jgi:hypothetical protein